MDGSTLRRVSNEGRRWIADGERSRCSACDRSFTLLFRRHHCRCCGSIFCSNCSNNRIVYQSSMYRACDGCADLFEEGGAVEVENVSCYWWARPYRKILSSLELNTDFLITSLTTRRSNDTLSMQSCPVCSISFGVGWDEKGVQQHVDKCLCRVERSGTVRGMQYSIHYWEDEGSGRECEICFEVFGKGQMIAVLNCLCQYHLKCIQSWFRRSRSCPFHSGN